MRKPNWCPNGRKTIDGMFIGGKFSKLIFDHLRFAKIEAYEDVPID